MIVTCSKCRARYAVDPQKIGPAGRTVQCARCSHRWFERTETPSAPEEAPPAPPEMVIRPATVGASLPAVIPPKPTFPWRRWAVAVAAALLLVVAAGALFVLRDQIRELFPSAGGNSTPATAAIATPSPTRPAGPEARPRIEIDMTASKIEIDGGRYVVRGQLVNNGTAAGSTSLLRVTFKHNDDVLGERSFPLVQGPLAPGGRANFSQVLDEPPAGTTDIVPGVE